MKLVLTSVGQDTELDTGEEVHTLTFNNGKLRICVGDKEMAKIVEFIKMSAGVSEEEPVQAKIPPRQPESFYIEPNNLNENNEQIWRDPYTQNGIGSGIPEEDMPPSNGMTDEEGAIEY